MIRKANKQDIPKIKELMESEPGFWDDSWRDNVLELGIDSANDLAFVWEEKGKVGGFACAHDLGFRAYLSELIVAKNFRNHGIARTLIEHIEKGLSSRGCKILISDVWKDAVDFYKSLNWSEPDVKLLRKRL